MSLTARPEDLGTFLGGQVWPRPLVEGLAGGGARGVDVGLRGQRHLADQFTGSR